MIKVDYRIGVYIYFSNGPSKESFEVSKKYNKVYNIHLHLPTTYNCDSLSPSQRFIFFWDIIWFCLLLFHKDEKVLEVDKQDNNCPFSL